ncbi:hypothetical protein [Thiomicrorhabdus sp.]|uniref:hypothetical protein n=1 Tax=Thiomicrorhabdus sp. TaxID=2039724 RepID=UPI0029C751BE|nr:hypothetical protein [Thiomicrorhabdus sp.]
MSYKIRELSDYLLPENPFSDKVNAIVHDEYQRAEQAPNDDIKREIDDGLYLAVKKRMKRRQYESDTQTYIIGLLRDLEDAENEFGQIAFESETTRSTFRNLRTGLLSLLN